jgi:hypothetical protein
MSDWGLQGLLWVVAAPLAGAFAAFLTTRRLAASAWSQSIGRTAKISAIAALVASTIAFPFVWFLGIVLGGTPGGALASSLGLAFGIPDPIAIPIGIGLGIFVVAWLCLSAVGCLTFSLARYAERAVRRRTTSAQR